MGRGEWAYQGERFRDVLKRWRDAEDPDPTTRDRVYNWLIGAKDDPEGWSTPDPEQPAIRSQRVAGTDVFVLFTLEHDQRLITLALISSGVPGS